MTEEVDRELPQIIWLFKDRSQSDPADWMPFWSKEKRYDDDVEYVRVASLHEAVKRAAERIRLEGWLPQHGDALKNAETAIA